MITPSAADGSKLFFGIIKLDAAQRNVAYTLILITVPFVVCCWLTLRLISVYDERDAKKDAAISKLEDRLEKSDKELKERFLYEISENDKSKKLTDSLRLENRIQLHDLKTKP